MNILGFRQKLRTICCITSLCILPVCCPSGFGQQAHARSRTVTLMEQDLPHLNGTALKATLLEVNYGPGEASPAHSHPCPVMVYVVAGAVRTKIQGTPEVVYRAGETFYEAPNGVHLISANASRTEPARMLAWFLCDAPRPLSVDPKPSGAKQ